MVEKTRIEKLYKAFLECGQKICTDTRKLEPGSIFFALKGTNFNANEFSLTAIQSGCKYAVIDEEKYSGANMFLVDDVLKALQQLANHHRRQLTIPIIGITGSNGKTTNKELIHAVLSKKYRTLATIGNLNNHIGVPLTLLSVTKQHEMAIVEMGANHQGEIEDLCKIAEPDYGLITNIGKAHLEGFGGIEGVKKGKSEMYRFIASKKGKIFVNGDDEVLMDLAKANEKIVYGTNYNAEVIGKNFPETEFVTFKWSKGEANWDKLPLVKTQIIGHYNFINLLCAACIGDYFKVSTENINAALSSYVPGMNRSQLKKTKSNTLILDAYNANPSSMKAAIENFSELQAPDKLLILGDMFELGKYAKEEHQKIIELLQDKKLRDVILVGKEFKELNSGYSSFLNTNECLDHLKKNQPVNKTILIKGSRGMKLEILKEVL
jgi:UDP-N-acetylmuramoyl-tripeptide--D-alanyl-D-alanine ligase